MKDRSKAYPTWGVGSKWRDKHLIFFDIDGKGITNVIEYLVARDIPFIVMETAKGYHVIGLELVTWKQLNSMWTALKPAIDNKWITLQRKRGFAVLRVCGKYPCQDIKPVLAYYPKPVDPEALKFLYLYLKMISVCRRLLGQCRR
ncbi:MAG: hypothetical protein GXO68_05740 [Crenarchaeota archaeon]|nr:hypothetical protein [Thermoproteota archaeon]